MLFSMENDGWSILKPFVQACNIVTEMNIRGYKCEKDTVRFWNSPQHLHTDSSGSYGCHCNEWVASAIADEDDFGTLTFFFFCEKFCIVLCYICVAYFILFFLFFYFFLTVLYVTKQTQKNKNKPCKPCKTGQYSTPNPEFACTNSSDSTTNYWFGAYVNVPTPAPTPYPSNITHLLTILFALRHLQCNC